jgi:hypothetical protein
MQNQPNPWKDFFHAYLDLGYALQSEIARDVEMSDQSAKLLSFLREISEQIDCAGGAEADPKSTTDRCRQIVHEVIARFRNKSKQIIFQDVSFFDEELMLFPSIDLDVAKLWRERPLYRTSLWHHIEQLYIIGNVCLHPNRKDQFLQAVKQLKAQAKPQGQAVDEGVAVAVAPEEEEEEDMDTVVNTMASMFGMDQNPAMKRMMAKMAKSLHGTMSSSENPMAMLQSIVSGDLSALGNLQEEMEKDISASIESGELTEADFAKSRDGMMQKVGGMDKLMQMAQEIGLQPGQPLSTQTPANALTVAPVDRTAQKKNSSTTNKQVKKKK